KIATHHLLAEASVPMPKSLYVEVDDPLPDDAMLKQHLGNPPYIAKRQFGTHGRHVALCTTGDEVRASIEYNRQNNICRFGEKPRPAASVVQPYIECKMPNGDSYALRVFVINHRVAAVNRQQATDSEEF